MNLDNLGSTALGGRRPETLGRSLVEHDWIGESQLARALARQKDRGGRLGTCLLEINAISEELLLTALSELLGVPKADAFDLRSIPEEVYELLPAEVAVRRRAVPFRATRQRVDIALADPDDLAVQDELSFIIGKSLTVHVATESRVYEALELYHGYECPIRYRRLLSSLNQRNRAAANDSLPAEAEDGEPETAAGDSGDAPRTDAGRTEEPAPASPRPSATYSPGPVPLAPAPKVRAEPPRIRPRVGSSGPDLKPMTLDLQATTRQLDHCTNVEEVGETLVEHLSGDFLRVVLLKTVKTQVRGWMGTGPGLDQERLLAYEVNLELPSIFLNLGQGGSFFLGVLPPMPPHLRLAQCWGDEMSNPCAVLPIRIRKRPVAFIYLDRDCLGLEGIDLDALQLIGRAASTAFGNCILTRKGRRD